MTQPLAATLSEFRVGITRERAKQIATEYLAAPGSAGWPINRVVSFEEVAIRAPQPYGFGGKQPSCIEECWIVYLEPAATLRSDTILLISKERGEVLFFGSAGEQV